MGVGELVLGAALTIAGGITGNPLLISFGVSAMLSGFGTLLRQTPKPVGTSGSIGFSSGVSPRRVLYGQFQTAGVLTYGSFPPSQNQATTNQFLHLIYTLTAHEISSFDAISIDGSVYNIGTDLLWDAVTGWWHLDPSAAGTFSDFYWQHLFFEFDFGRDSSAQPFPQLAGADSAWTSACLQRKCAKVHVVLRADSGWTGVFPGGQIPNFQFLITGKKLIDPRIVTAWQPSTGYLHYQWFEDTRGIVWVQTNTSGTSSAGGARPNFEGSGTSWPVTVADNTLSWTTYGRTMTQIQAGTDSAPQGHLVNGVLVNDAWAPGATYALGTIIEAPVGYLQQQTVSASGTTGTGEPNFNTSLGGATAGDGSAAWVCLGRSWHAINPSNNALCVYDFLLDSEFGMEAPVSSIDVASVIAAANVCDEQVLIIWNPDNSVVHEDLYSCNGEFDHSSIRGNVLSSLCASMAGWIVPPGDLWHVFAGAYVVPTVTLTDADLRGGIKGDFRLSKRDVANGIKGTYVPAFLPTSPAGAISMNKGPSTWQSQSYPPYQANGLAGKPNYLNSEDGGQVIWQDVNFDFCTSLWLAQRLAKIALMRLRFQETLTLQCKLTAFSIEAGDVFAFSHPRWGFTAGNFEATQVSLTFDGAGSSKDAAPVAGVDIVARQVDQSIYNFQAPASSSDYGEYSPYGVTGVMTGVE